jgi:5'-phosphate synthase pdxT subunit
LNGIDGIVLPGGESTAMGLIGNAGGKNLWTELQEFSKKKPTWGTCAGMILLAEKCVGASAVIQDGQSLIGGVDVLVCRNYFGSQVSSFEMATPSPPGDADKSTYPGIFIRAPAILTAGPGVEILGKVFATPCRQAAVVLQELENKIAKGENVVMMGVVDALERKGEGINFKEVKIVDSGEEKKDVDNEGKIELPGAADGSNAREVICAVRTNNTLCTAFHPELTRDYRWHSYFGKMVKESMSA